MKFILAISSMALLSARGGGGDNGGLNDLDKEWRAGFVELCNSSAVASGAPADVATKVCDCSADKIIDQYNLIERAQFDGDNIDKLKPIIMQCVKETGADKG